VIPDELNTYDVLVNDWLVFSKATLASAVARFGAEVSTNDDADAAVDEEVAVDEEAGEE
jgi:hypothetical protein